MSLDAANPHINATVTASAGSGKTYMLVTRILRILLEGAEPGSILAMTFTRKAAAEMQQRLSERLYQLATADDKTLSKLLAELQLDNSYQKKARELYEELQYADYPVRTLTFHSFCQDLLARFPLEADIPPNFDLLESSELLIQQAREALYNEATLDMQGELANRLQHLLKQAGSLFNLDKVLDSFLQHRSDWWAYTDAQTDAVTFAQKKLADTLQITLNTDPLDEFFSPRLTQQISQFAPLLVKASGKKNLACADSLANWLLDKEPSLHQFHLIKDCFLKKDGEPMVQGRNDSAALRKRLAEDDELFFELNEILTNKVLQTIDLINRQDCWRLNADWYYCGEKFVEHYQQLKTQQRLLDFTDLEWRSYKLLQDSDNALWIQYKLDQQIQHLLIDEFQDTNPTQWQLILPLLEEMAAAESERSRSVFLVGDEKQSIYSFRRAKPELQQQASDWLAQNLNAQAFPLNKSWRSSPAIINTVNAVFAQPELQKDLPGFSEHFTHHDQLPGRVEVLPLLKPEDLPEIEEAIYCRNPLLQPRLEAHGLHQLEAQQITQHIKALISQQTPVIENDNIRPLNFNDIFILVRKRSHVADYEQALRQANIPYLGTNRGTFLSCLEVQDMEALLETLLTPFNNLALAQVLKSPLFNASDDDLQLVASNAAKPHWFERIQLLAETLDTDHPIHRAATLITHWRTLADKIPVHDLLDKIFDQGDVMQRYHRATPKALQARVKANLTLFLEMALDLDSGRYPSLMHFLDYLRSLKATPEDAPDEAPMETREPRVRILTIHASKGLEAPVVYLADTITSSRDKSALSTLVDWPVDKRQPQLFQLIPSRQRQDTITAQINQSHLAMKNREDANLLYVAITRARQYLFVSGCKGKLGPFLDWYQPVFNALQQLTENTEDTHLVYQYGELPDVISDNNKVEPTPSTNFVIPLELTRKLKKIPSADTLIAPSYMSQTPASQKTSNEDVDAQLRGIAIHRMLQLMTQQNDLDSQQLLRKISIELKHNNLQELNDWLSIALENFSHPDLQHIFKPNADYLSYSECPVHFQHQQQPAFGIIDRIIVEPQRVLLVDYKTHQQASTDNLQQLAMHYQQQMQLYSEACQQLWPDKVTESFLLFTESRSLYSMSPA